VRDVAGVSLDAGGQANLGFPLYNPVQTDIEALLGGWVRFGTNYVLRVGLGRGFTRAIGSPAARGILSVSWDPPIASKIDQDLDGVPNRIDACVDKAEDLDQYQDEDGCPDAITRVTFELRDPWGDPIDVAHTIVQLIGGGEAYQFSGGTAELELGPGGYEIVAEAAHYFEMKDRFTVVSDQSSHIAKAMTLLEPPAPVKVTASHIAILDKIYFDTDSANISSNSFGILDAVASAIQAHPDILLLRIEGHTDSQGSNGYNTRLSRKRAEAVRNYLVGSGVDPERLISEGLGESSPLDPRDTPDAWERNRRVEFHIEQRNR
jgi:outer membrane protein OmpA-like peptidoglycan-associated protein